MSYRNSTPLCDSIANTHKVERIIRISEMLTLLKISRTTLYRWTKNKEFATPIRKGKRIIGWKVSSYQHWLQQQ